MDTIPLQEEYTEQIETAAYIMIQGYVMNSQSVLDKMKQEIQEFKKQNGNITYTTKELIGALHTKFDRLEERFETIDSCQKRIQGVCDTRGTWLKIILPLFISMMGGLLFLILQLHGIL